MKTIVIAGNVGKDAIVRTTPKGDKVAGWTVAVDDGFGDAKRTLWFDVSLWGARAEKLATYITKGTKMAVAGDFSTREHDGRTYLTIRANEVTLQGGGQRDTGGFDEPRGGRNYGTETSTGGGGKKLLDDLVNSIPFRPEWR